MLTKKLMFGAFVALATLSVGLGGCAGQVAEVDTADDDHEVADIDSTSAALTAEAQSATDDAEKCDDRERDPRKHHNHRHHKFKVLDRLDGTHDQAITIASLPPGLPDRLIAKLTKIDADGDGIVTKAEAKAWMHQKKQGPRRH